jgi:hypothetical protein
MIPAKDFAALLKVFKAAAEQMVEPPTFHERQQVIKDWMDMMKVVDVALGNLLRENNVDVRRKMVAEFKELAKEYEYEEPVSIVIDRRRSSFRAWLISKLENK